MKYFTRMHDEVEVEEISKSIARRYLEGCYTKESVDDLFENERSFRLFTPFRDVWTETEIDGHKVIPMAGVYGIVG